MVRSFYGLGTAAGAAIGSALGGGLGGLLGGKKGAKKGAEKGRLRAARQANRQFRKDAKANRRRKVAEEIKSRTAIEQANAMVTAQKQMSDDALLAGSMKETPIRAVGGSQFDRFESSRFG